MPLSALDLGVVDADRNPVLLSYENLRDLKQGLSDSIDNLDEYDRSVDEFSNQVNILRHQMNTFSLSAVTLSVPTINEDQFAKEQRSAKLNESKEYLPPLPKSKPPKMSVRFMEDDPVEQADSASIQANRCSNEIEEINAQLRAKAILPRSETPAALAPDSSQQSNESTCSSESNSPEPMFRPISVTRSNEYLAEHGFTLVRPVPLFASKSIQDLRATRDERRSNLDSLFYSKSSDDLIFPDIDGMTKITNLSKFKKNRCNRASSNSLISLFSREDEPETIYANIEFSRKDKPKDIVANKKPQPLPRSNSNIEIDEVNSNKSQAKTLVYVIDKAKNEFVLADEKPISTLPERETQIPKYFDSVNTYDDAKLEQLKRTSFIFNKSKDPADLIKGANNTKPRCKSSFHACNILTSAVCFLCT